MQKDRFLLPVLYLIPLFIGLMFVFESNNSPSFTMQLSDSKSYLVWAEAMASGKGFGHHPYYVNPGYLFFLTLLAKLSLGSVLAIRIAQVFLGSFTYLLVFLCGSNYFGRNAGLYAYALTIGYGMLAAANTELSGAWGETLLFLLLAWIFSKEMTLKLVVAAGLVAGFTALWRPNIIAFAAVVVVVIFIPGERMPARSVNRTLSAVVFVLAFMLPIIPVTIRNLTVGKDMVLISSHGGINFYIGNSEGAKGGFYPPPGFFPGIESINLVDSVKIASARTRRTLAPSEASRFWFRQGIEFLTSKPASAVKLYARKAFMMAHSYEVPLNYEYSILKENSIILKIFTLPFAVILVAGIAGIALLSHRWRDLLHMHLLIGTQAVSVLVFFISYRYRLPLAPLLSVYGGYALERGIFRVRRWTLGDFGWAVPAAAAVLLLSYPYPLVRNMQRGNQASYFEALGTSYHEQGDMKDAEAAFRRAIGIVPAMKASHWYLGLILESRGEYRSAMEEYELAANLYGPDTPSGKEARVRYIIVKQTKLR